MLHSSSKTIGSGQEPRDMMTESSSEVKVPAARFGSRRHAHVPSTDEVAERGMHSLLDRAGDRRVGDVSNLNVNRIDDEHQPQRCNCGTVNCSSRTWGEGEKRCES